MTRSLKYGLLLAAALAAPASAVDSDLTEAIAYHCGWQLGQFSMQSTDITKEELPKCKEIRLRANLIHQTQEEVQKNLPEALAFTCGLTNGINYTKSIPDADYCKRIQTRALGVIIPPGAFAP
jgi:hypothetical protein